MQFTIEQRGLDDVLTRMVRFENAIVNMRPVMERIAMRLEGEIEKNFANQSAAGRKWKPLQPATLAFKRFMNYPDDILVATGALKKSLREGGDGNIHDFSALHARVGTTIEYAAAHQDGVPKRNLPQREFAVVSEEFRKANIKRIQRWIVEGKLT